MNGRDHVICNVSVLGTAIVLDTIAVTEAQSQVNTTIASALDSVLLNVNDWLLAGNSFFSLFTVLALTLFIFGSLLPDIDSKDSALGRFIHIPVKHRTWLHALYIPIILFIASIWIRLLFYVALGYLMHLFFDSLSVCGICWFYPYPGYVSFDGGARVKRHHFVRFYRNGSTGEYVITGLCVICFALSVIYIIAAGIIK